MKKLLIATHNTAKFADFTKLFSDLPLQVIFLKHLNLTDMQEEDGENYLENSQKKALFYAQKSGLPTIAEDGGLEIVALDNAPGLHSKRWLGENMNEENLINHLHAVAQKLPDSNRDAYFKTVVSFALPAGFVWSGKGEIKGIIAKKPHTKMLSGFPYRSFFFLPQLNKYFYESELTSEEITQHSHRHKAVAKLKPVMREKIHLF